MTVRPILIYGDPMLHEKSEPVEEINEEVLELIDDMFQTMIESNGIGLAAIQLGIKKSVIVIDLPKDDENNSAGSMLMMINTEIVDRKGLCTFEEGCLSLPGVNAEVERPEEITVRFTDRPGRKVEMTCGGLLARVIQHEYDHLSGILFIQYLKPADRTKLAPQLRRLAKGVAV